MSALVLTFAILLAASGCPQETPAPGPTQKAGCNEDQPCWNCKTMGNKRCGPLDRKSIPAKPRRTVVAV